MRVLGRKSWHRAGGGGERCGQTQGQHTPTGRPQARDFTSLSGKVVLGPVRKGSAPLAEAARLRGTAAPGTEDIGHSHCPPAFSFGACGLLLVGSPFSIRCPPGLACRGPGHLGAHSPCIWDPSAETEGARVMLLAAGGSAPGSWQVPPRLAWGHDSRLTHACSRT